MIKVWQYGTTSMAEKCAMSLTFFVMQSNIGVLKYEYSWNRAFACDNGCRHWGNSHDFLSHCRVFGLSSTSLA